MDPLSQALFGTSVTASIKRKNSKNLSVNAIFVISALSAMAPDLDVFIRSESNPLLFLKYHRHFTHSLIFIPFASIVLTALFQLLFKTIQKKSPHLKEIFPYVFISYATHGVLDACTTYGTHLLWPFSNHRSAWGIIGVIDPLYSTLLMLCTIYAYRYLKTGSVKKIFLKLSLFFMISSFIYLAFGLFQKTQAFKIQQKLLEQRNHQAKVIDVKPTILNLFLWRSIYEYDGRYYIDGIHSFMDSKVYPGDSIVKVSSQDLQFENLSTTKKEDLRVFEHFSSGYIARDLDNENLIIDVRYSMLPNSLKSLWGINLKATSKHVDYVVMREVSTSKLKTFFKMILGR